MAHEIKTVTPIQLTIDRLKNKYSNIINSDEKNNFNKHLKTIHKQITQIESLMNNFRFCQNAKTGFKINLSNIIKKNNLLNQIDDSIKLIIMKIMSILFLVIANK